MSNPKAPLKLRLNREVLRRLNATDLERAVGGICSRGSDSRMSGCSTISTFDLGMSHCDPCCEEEGGGDVKTGGSLKCA